MLQKMMELYCRKKHGGKTLCKDCTELFEYATIRSEKCTFKGTKTYCKNCMVQCYRPEMREKIRKVMRFSGPRMIFYAPVLVLKHLIAGKKGKKD